VIDEQTELDTKVKLVHGYAESKLAAEQLVWEASRRGVPVAVYRPGGVTGHTASGISNTGDILSRMIRGVAELGRCPEGDAPLDMVPVDYVAQAVAVGVRTCSVGTRPYHLTHPEPCRWADVLQAIQTKGFPVTKVSMPDWRRIVNDEIGANKQGVLFPLLPLLQASSVGEKVEVVMMQFKCSDTARRLDHAGVRCPTLSPQILDRYLQFFVDTGYLPQCA
jgi:thioester reductase-like protein